MILGKNRNRRYNPRPNELADDEPIAVPVSAASESGERDSNPFIGEQSEEQAMKRIPKLVVMLSGALFAAGCGHAHDDREATREVRKLTNETAADVNHAAQDAEHAAHEVTRAVNAATVGAETEVRQAALQLRDDVRRQGEAIQVRHDADVIPPADPSQLRREVKRDAVDAAGAAAEAAAEKLLKFK
jgi:hypothetical protein